MKLYLNNNKTTHSIKNLKNILKSKKQIINYKLINHIETFIYIFYTYININIINMSNSDTFTLKDSYFNEMCLEKDNTIIDPVTSNTDTHVKQNYSDKQCKKIKRYKKKKKKNLYKKFLKSAKKSEYNDDEKKNIYREKLKKSLGGGTFTKHTLI